MAFVTKIKAVSTAVPMKSAFRENAMRMTRNAANARPK